MAGNISLIFENPLKDTATKDRFTYKKNRMELGFQSNSPTFATHLNFIYL